MKTCLMFVGDDRTGVVIEIDAKGIGGNAEG